METSDDVKCPDSSRQAFLEETGALWMCGRGGRLFQLLKQREHAHESFDAVMMMVRRSAKGVVQNVRNRGTRDCPQKR